jgi:hypothetical protein
VSRAVARLTPASAMTFPRRLVGGLTTAAVAGLFGAVWSGSLPPVLRRRTGGADVIRRRDEPDEPSPRMPTEEL